MKPETWARAILAFCHSNALVPGQPHGFSDPPASAPISREKGKDEDTKSVGAAAAQTRNTHFVCAPFTHDTARGGAVWYGMLDRNHRKLIVAAAQSASGPEPSIKAMLEAAEGRNLSSKEAGTLLSQAEKARQLGVSRFTIRKMVAAGVLTPIELLPGLVCFRAADLV